MALYVIIIIVVIGSPNCVDGGRFSFFGTADASSRAISTISNFLQWGFKHKPLVKRYARPQRSRVLHSFCYDVNDLWLDLGPRVLMPAANLENPHQTTRCFCSMLYLIRHPRAGHGIALARLREGLQ